MQIRTWTLIFWLFFIFLTRMNFVFSICQVSAGDKYTHTHVCVCTGVCVNFFRNDTQSVHLAIPPLPFTSFYPLCLPSSFFLIASALNVHPPPLRYLHASSFLLFLLGLVGKNPQRLSEKWTKGQPALWARSNRHPLIHFNGQWR